MSLRALFPPEVCIRLTDDLDGLVCTIRHGWFSKSDEYAVEPHPAAQMEPIDAVSEPMRLRRPRYAE